MRIAPVGFKSFQDTFSSKKEQKKEIRTQAKPETINNLANHPVFLGKKKDYQDWTNIRQLKKMLSLEAEEIYENSKKLAIMTGSKEIETKHLYLSSLYFAKKYIKAVDNGTIRSEDLERIRTTDFIKQLGNSLDDPYKNKEKRKEILNVIDRHIKSTKRDLFKDDKPKRVISPQLSKNALSDLYETFEKAVNNHNTSTFHGDYFLVASTLSNDIKLAKESGKLVLDIQKAIMTDDVDKNKNHLQFYDNKADAIWRNLSAGNDVICHYAEEDKDSSNHLISSFVNLINKPGVEYKNINPENTKIFVLNNNATLDFLNFFISDIKQDN